MLDPVGQPTTPDLTIIVDGANVVGATPDGWWRDRAGAAARLRDELEDLAEAGVSGATIGWPEVPWFDVWVVIVLEGKARDAGYGTGRVETVMAAGEGDDQIVTEVRKAERAGDLAIVATADKALQDRIERAGGISVSPGQLRRMARIP